MPRSGHLLPLVLPPSERDTAEHLTGAAGPLLALLALLALLTLVASTAEAQERAAAETPLHLAANRFEFVASADTVPPAKPLRVHNGGAAPLTDVRLTRLAYADSARGAAWLVALPRQTAVAPDELAIVGTLCVDAAGLPVGTHRATAAVVSREAPEPVAITITLVVTDAAARAPGAAPRCAATAAK